MDHLNGNQTLLMSAPFQSSQLDSYLALMVRARQ
ncbi:hypothetical protein QF019_004263 [Pseudomonas frederiksbergensis]